MWESSLEYIILKRILIDTLFFVLIICLLEYSRKVEKRLILHHALLNR